MNKKGFTLVELLVGMALIIILFMGITTVNFKESSDKQRLEIFGNKIISKIETARSNDLIGRGITQGGVLINPDSWKIELNSAGQGYMRVFYGVSGTYYNFDELFFENLYNINSIVCEHPVNDPQTLTIAQTGAIIFEKGKYSIGGNCLLNPTEIILNIGYKNFESDITFNAISGLLKRN